MRSTTQTASLRGIQFPFISIPHSFQSQHPVQIYNMARNLRRPLAKWQHQPVSLVETEQLCRNNTAWKTLRTQLGWGKNVTMARCGGLPFFSLLAVNFPCQITLVRGPKDGAHRITMGGRNQIAQFPIRSLAEIWNNNPHQGLAMSVNFPIHWTMARNQTSLSV